MVLGSINETYGNKVRAVLAVSNAWQNMKNNVQSSSNTIESFTLIETPNRKKEGKIKNEKSIS